jgi:acetylxylan esterase
MPSFPGLFKGLVATLTFLSTGYGASLQTVKDWGDNPSGISQMQIYVPDKIAAKPAIILGVSL